ncbi:MAG: GAF domain-containing protein [Anaerolineae bacterium]|nr:GAF domain-containing protein [Anaerolineae bacterium]
MIWQETPYTVPLAVVTAVLVVSALYVWWHRKVPWAKTGTLLVLAGAVWLLGYTLELASAPLAAKLFWAKVQYVGIVIVPTGSLAFVLQYTGRQKWLKPAILISSVISFVTLLLVITNEAHGLIWTRVWNRVVPGVFGGYWDSDKDFGIGYWVFVAQSLATALVAVFLLAHMLVRSIHLYRWQSVALLFAVFVFLLGAAIEAFNDSPPDFVVLGFATACLIVAWCLARLRRGDVRSVSYTVIFQSMNDGVVVLDAHNTIIDLNSAALRLADLRVSKEAVGQPVERVWPNLIVPAEDETEEEMALERDGGQRRVYSVDASSVLGWHGRLVSRVITLHDVTERKRAEQEIAHHLARTQVLREVMLAAASTLEFDQVLERTIRALWEMLGVEFIGFARPAEDGDGLGLHPACIRSNLEMGDLRIPLDGSVCGHVFQSGKPEVIGDVRQVSYYFEGHPLVRSELAIPVHAAGEIIGVLNMESRHLDAFAEEDLSFYIAIAGQLGMALENARLYKEVYRYAGELAHAVTELKGLDRLKNEFIQGVSHELRAPLALIRGYAELLDSGELGALSPLQKGPVEIITRRARMMGNLVEDIAMLLTAKARVLVQEPLALGELARASVEDFHLAADQASLTLRAEIASGLPPVDGVPVYLRRLLDNLVGNAIKFTPEGGSITVRVYREDGWIVLQVADTGVGISPEEQERIFERFYQADGSGGRHRGFGLGLTLVKEIVAAHGGTINVESVLGAGSTFTVKLPVAE